MEELESKAISTAPIDQGYGLGMLMIPLSSKKAEHIQQFLHHINSIDPHTQFTTESPNSNSSHPFPSWIH